MQMGMEIWSMTWTLEVGEPVPETLLLTLCVPHVVLLCMVLISILRW